MRCRESPCLCACKRESATAASSMLDETLPTPRVPLIQLSRTSIKVKKATFSGFFNFGGGGGNRTRVQRSSTDSSTYLVLSFNLIHLSRTHTLQVNESPFV